MPARKDLKGFRVVLESALSSSAHSLPDTGRHAARLWWWHGLALLVFLAAVAYASAGGLRGSDQYWYVADVETLLTSGETVTNNVFPVALLAGQTPPLPFVHNVLSVYLAAVPAFFLGSYWGWLTLNVIGTLLCCGLLHRTCRRFGDEQIALLASLAYLVFPLTFWQAAQPLGEASIPPLIALALYLLARARTEPRWWLALCACAGLLYFSRQSLVLVLVAVPFGYLLRTWGGGARRRGATVLGLFAIVAGSLLVGHLLFKQEAVELTYARVLHGVVPGVPGQEDNMAASFDLSLDNLAGTPPVRPAYVALKIEAAIREQLFEFTSLQVAGVYWAFNLLALLTLVALWRFRHDPGRLTVVAGAVLLLLVHTVTVCVHQNQMRYLLIPLPGVIVAASLLLHDLIRPRWRAPVIAWLAAGMTLAAAPLQLMGAHVSHAEGTDARRAVEEISTQVGRHVAAGEPVMVTWLNDEQAIAYALRPRSVLFVRPNYSLDQYQALRARLPTRWLIAETTSPALATLGIEVAPLVTFGFQDGRWGLFRLPSRPS